MNRSKLETKKLPASDPHGQLLLPLNRPEEELIPESNRARIISLLGEMMRCAIDTTFTPSNRNER